MDKKHTKGKNTIWDISPLISSRIGVFPGDTPFQRQVLLDFQQGHNLLLSSLSTTVHLGAHTDAPNHYHPKGEAIHTRSLNYYLGLCQVIRVQVEGRIFPEHVKHVRKEKEPKILAPRVLFATESFPNPDQWNSDFASLSPELIEWLAGEGVKLVGIDTPSVDPQESKGLESHQKIYEYDMAILEGIVLDGVPEGLYTLIALPLKIEAADASPVRAVLLSPPIDF